MNGSEFHMINVKDTQAHFWIHSIYSKLKKLNKQIKTLLNHIIIQSLEQPKTSIPSQSTYQIKKSGVIAPTKNLTAKKKTYPVNISLLLSQKSVKSTTSISTKPAAVNLCQMNISILYGQTQPKLPSIKN